MSATWRSFCEVYRRRLKSARARIKASKAPGAIGIPPEVVKCVAEVNPNYVLAIYNDMAARGDFPKLWRRARLVLIRKSNKPVNDPSSYRPICLLDIEGKLYEQLLLERLKEELNRTGGLAENQYGFREGR